MTPEAENHARSSSQNGRAPVKLLCVGNDEALLSYRSKVLTQAGFQVVSIRPQPGQANQFANLCRLHGPAMLIACHTLSLNQRIDLSRELRESCPRTKLLALTNGSPTAEEARSYDWLLDSLDGPAALIHHIRDNV
ncbi:MAG: response regulator [Acidobacteria bacterium]|nr:response regulator [Acidobacteriota bacterium]